MKQIFIALMLCAGLMTGSCCKEGLDGKATVIATIKHHDSLIAGATVYIKFDAKEAPASLGDYDQSFSAGTNESTIRIENMKCGDYFFYATGFDPNISEPVKGGVPYTIRHADRKGEANIIIPVTEE
jgi:hypothetical protein